MRASFSGSMLAVASSRMTMGASFKSARAIEMRCFWPPESAAPPSPTIVSYPSGSASANSSTLARCAARLTSSSVAFGLPKRMLFSMVSLKR